jgi:hypothetical protein
VPRLTVTAELNRRGLYRLQGATSRHNWRGRNTIEKNTSGEEDLCEENELVHVTLPLQFCEPYFWLMRHHTVGASVRDTQHNAIGRRSS